MEIIPRLPNDLSRECFLRVPLTSHSKLPSVSKSWESIVTNPQFYKNRKKSGASQELIILVVDKGDIKICDPLEKSLESLPLITINFQFHHCVSVNHRMFVMGFYGGQEVRRLTFAYDFRYGTWKRGSDIPNERSDFACSVDSSNGLIYIAGGCGYGRGVAVYDVEEEKWDYLPYIQCWSFVRPCHSAFTDEKLYVAQGNTDRPIVEYYDPNTREWSYIANFPSWPSVDYYTRYRLEFPPLPAFGRLFFFSYGRIIEFDYVEKRFRTIEERIGLLIRFKGMTLWKDQILIFGTDSRCCKLYLFEPGHEGTKGKWTLLSSWPREHMDEPYGSHYNKCYGTLTSSLEIDLARLLRDLHLYLKKKKLYFKFFLMEGSDL